MTAVLTVGRVGLDIDMDGPSKIDWDGPDRFTFSGEIITSSTAVAEAQRQQVLGLTSNPWEPYVPFTWTGDTLTNGLVKVTASRVGTVNASYLDGGYFPVSLTCEKVRHYQSPRVESRSYGANRYPIATTGPVPWIGLPIAASAVTWSANPSGFAPFTRIGPGGTAQAFGTADANQYLYNSWNSYSLSPSHWYDMAATIKVGASTKYAVTGDQLPLDGAVNTWELSNGLLRVTKSGSNGISLEAPKGSATSTWATAHDIKFQAELLGAYQSFTDNLVSVSVIRNSPEECILRLVYHWSPFSTQIYRMAVDLSLRRGSHYVDITMSSDAAWKWAVTSAGSATWATVGSYAIAENADNADSNRWELLGVGTQTAASKRMQSSSAARSDSFGAGVAVGGASAAAQDTTGAISAQWEACVTESYRVVSP